MFAKTQHKTKSENVLPHRQWRRAHYSPKVSLLVGWLPACLPVLLAARLITLTLRQVCSTLNANLQILVRVMENNFFPKFSLSLLILVLLLLSLLLLLCALYDVRCCLTYNQPTNNLAFLAFLRISLHHDGRHVLDASVTYRIRLGSQPNSISQSVSQSVRAS